MKFTRKKVILGILIALILSPFLMTKESKIKDFPVSIFSTYVEDENPVDYQYTSFLPLIAIKMKGWTKTSSEGEMTIFKKGDRTVSVIHPPGKNAFYLYEVK